MLPASKHALCVRGLTSANAGTDINGYVDRLGYDFMTLDVYLTTVDNATNNPSTFKLGDGDVTNVSSASDITAFVGDGSGGWTIPTMSTATTTNNVVKFNVDCRGLKRYITLEIVPLTTMTCWAFAELFNGDDSPTNSTQANTIALVEG